MLKACAPEFVLQLCTPGAVLPLCRRGAELQAPARSRRHGFVRAKSGLSSALANGNDGIGLWGEVGIQVQVVETPTREGVGGAIAEIVQHTGGCRIDA